MTTDLRVVSPDLNVWSALAIMNQGDIRHLLVMDGDRLVGVLSNRDYRRILEQARPDGSVQHIRDYSVRQIMTRKEHVVTVGPDTPLLDVAELIVSRRIGCVPVVDNLDRPVGILTQKDVMAALIDVCRSR
ncbi:MAG TPA: CBS domain-containing protein [Methylomirabilota bacterium]|nr:CBS domain-containing protein [Methylomirabilota bacterium]